MTTFGFRQNKHGSSAFLIKAAVFIFVLFMRTNACSSQTFILKYNLYETFYKNYFLNSEIFLNSNNTISLGLGYLYQPNISKVSYGKFSCKGVNGLLEYRRYIDFNVKDTLGNVRKLKGFFIGGYGRIFNFKYSYDSLTGGNKYTSVTSDNRELYAFGIEAGFQAVYRKISFEIFIGYGLLWQYDYINRFINDPPYIQPADNISPWAKHHIGVGIGYVFRDKRANRPKK